MPRTLSGRLLKLVDPDQVKMFSYRRICFYILLVATLAFMVFMSGVLNVNEETNFKANSEVPKPLSWKSGEEEQVVKGPNRGIHALFKSS